MTPLPVRFTVRALNDLDALEDWIANEASAAIGRRFADDLVAFCNGLAQFPNRGTVRTNLRSNLRAIGFRRRVTIMFRVGPSEVVIARIHYRGRDWLPRP